MYAAWESIPDVVAWADWIDFHPILGQHNLHTAMRIFHIAAVLLLAASALSAAEPPLRCIEPSEETGTSRAVVVGDVPLVFTSQVLPITDDGHIESPDDAELQAHRVLKWLGEQLEDSKSNLQNTVKLNVYASNEQSAAAAGQAIAKQFAGKTRPAISLVVTRLPHQRMLVAMDAVAVAETANRNEVTTIHRLDDPDDRQNAVNSLPEFLKNDCRHVLPPGRKIFIAGQAEKADDVKGATQKTMESLAKTLKFLGRTNDDIVQLKCFVKPVTAESARDVEAGMKAVLGDGPLPPVVLVEWESSLPIEIELVAYGGPIEAEMPAVEYLTPPGMTTSPVYSRVARTASQETIFISGLFGKPESSAQEETEQLFAQLSNILKASGSDFRHLAKATYYVSTEDASSQLNAQRPTYYDAKRPPAASKALVRAVGLPGRTTTLDMIAVPAK